MKSYDLIVFDWDGTLMDSVGRILACLRGVALDNHLPPPSEQAMRDIIGLSLDAAMLTLFPGMAASYYPVLQQSYRQQYRQLADVATPIFADIPRLLATLQAQQYQLAVATGKSRPGLDRALQETQLLPFFSHSRCADEAHSKPHPDMLQQLLAETGVSADRALMVGDSVLDLQMASAAGMDAVGVSYGAHSPQKLWQAAPKAVIAEPLALLPVLSSS